MTLHQLRSALREAGARPVHEAAVLRSWLLGQPMTTGATRPDRRFPARLLAALPALGAALAGVVTPHDEQAAADGSARWLLALQDGETVESVLLPPDGLCVSTQVGCAVGCGFCMTGQMGLRRQLDTAEILGQVALARARRPVRRVVFMGMGEPAHNLERVLEAIQLLGTAGGLGHKDLVFSTVGDRRVFARLPAAPVRPALALSLHTTRADLRARLLPRAPAIAPAELVALARDYGESVGYPIQYQWTLLAGVNDGDEEADALAELLQGHYAVVNFIPWNEVAGVPFRRPPPGRAEALCRRLRTRGILAKIRRSAGQDVAAGCGQLRSRATPPCPRRSPICATREA